MTLTTASPYMATGADLFAKPFSRQGLRIQSSSSSYVEYGWAYTRDAINGYQRRVYYINNVNGADPSPHYLHSIGVGKYRFNLYNSNKGSSPNKFRLQLTNLATGATTLDKVLDPPYDWGEAIASVSESNSCSEATMETENSQRLTPSVTWQKVTSINNASWWYHIDQNTHWSVGWWGNYEEWFTFCKYPEGCTH